MSDTTVVLTLKKNRATARIEGTRVAFSPHRCFAFDDGAEDVACLQALASYLAEQPGLAFVGSRRFADYLFRHVPDLSRQVIGMVPYSDSGDDGGGRGLASVTVDTGLLPDAVRTVFLCDTLTFPRMQVRRSLPKSLKIVEPTILAEIASATVPARAWTPLQRNIYPIDIPAIEFRAGLDFAIVDPPSRNLALMPNGLGYLSNALKKTNVSYQILDLDIIAYHRFHVHRLYDAGGSVVLPGDLTLPEDPWQAEHYDLWTTNGGGADSTGRNEVLEFFRPVIDEAIDALVRARPKVLGLSIQGCNEAAAREIALGVKTRLPDIVVVVGGFSCYNADIGRRAFPECDYMCIGEADLTVAPLIEALARGERPYNQPGILSRFDTPEFKYLPAPMVHDLDRIAFPRYEWCDLSVYRNFNDYQLTPIIASRGCRWSRCTFCAERFYWRIRTPENFVDELEWLVNQGCHLFMFNESDLGGMPERVLEICDEVIRRGLHRKVKLTGQLRVNKNQDKAFFTRLREANFVALRFGIDAFSENTLRLQKKGYTVEMISQNLKDCWEAGIFTEVNWVIGVPGETDQDIAQGIDLILKNRQYIGRLANINPLILVNGSVYWIDPDAHNIVFKEAREQVYAKYPRALPADQWHSTSPYIDAQVRKERFERIVIALHDAGFAVGAWANRIIEDVKLSRDKARTGSATDTAGFGEFEIAGGERVRPDADPSEEEQAVDLASRRAPLEEASHPSETIPIQAIEGRPEKGAAESITPSGTGGCGERPRLLRKTASHDVVLYDGWYYGIPHALADVDLGDPQVTRTAGILRFPSESEVVSAIEDSARWANSRGQYDDQEKQRVSGSYLRADSVGEMRVEHPPSTEVTVLRYHGSYLAVDKRALAQAFTSPRFRRGTDRKRSATTSDTARRISGATLARRLAARLPQSVVERVRHLIRQQSYSSGATSAPLVTKTDGQLAGMLVRALGDAYIRRPIVRLRNTVTGRGTTEAAAGAAVKVEGQDFTIAAVVTKNTQPELMWTIESFNVVKYDGSYYAVPHGTSVDWDTGTVAAIPGVLTGPTVVDVVSKIEDRSRASVQETAAVTPSARHADDRFHSKDPILLGAMESEGYNIVAYEGWIFGIPHKLGSIDLTAVDVMEIPGVIRDVSRDAVESEVMTRSRDDKRAA